VITAADIVTLRPGDGLDPMYLSELVGTTLRRPLRRHEPFLAEDIEPGSRQVKGRAAAEGGATSRSHVG
jgi:hypothetical protein